MTSIAPLHHPVKCQDLNLVVVATVDKEAVEAHIKRRIMGEAMTINREEVMVAEEIDINSPSWVVMAATMVGTEDSTDENLIPLISITSCMIYKH